MNEYLKDDKENSLKDKLVELKEYINRNKYNAKFELISGDVKLSYLKPKEILVYVNEQLYYFEDIFSELYKKSELPPFFYIYCDKETKTKLNSISPETGKKIKYDLITYIKKYKYFQSTSGC